MTYGVRPQPELSIDFLRTPPSWESDHTVIVGPLMMEWPASEMEGEDWLTSVPIDVGLMPELTYAYSNFAGDEKVRGPIGVPDPRRSAAQNAVLNRFRRL